jgi:hypothetical protein
MSDNIHGFKIEQGPRKYRPEYKPDHLRKHTAFFIPIEDLDKILFPLRMSPDSLYRAAWVAAASEAHGFFLDMMQVPDKLPAVGPGDVWCGILNDDEPNRGGGRGPGFFDQPGLIRLVGLADSIIVNAAGLNPEIYAIGVERTAKNRKNSLLIETTGDFEREWYGFVLNHRRNARCTLVTPNPFDPTRYRLLATPHDDTSH